MSSSRSRPGTTGARGCPRRSPSRRRRSAPSRPTSPALTGLRRRPPVTFPWRARRKPPAPRPRPRGPRPRRRAPRPPRPPAAPPPRRAAGEAAEGGGVLTPALVIGLGQMGLYVLKQLRQELHDQFGGPDALP